MSRRPRSRSVSWDDESPTICPSNSESLCSDQNYDASLSDVCFSYDEAGVESMTPLEFRCYRRRLWHTEKMNVLLRHSFRSLYTPFYLDREIIRWLPGQPSGKGPEFDPILIVMRDIAAENVKQLVEPFRATRTVAARDPNEEIEDVTRAAKVLFRMLQYDGANYSFYAIKDQSCGEPLLRYSQLRNATQKVDICGASHRDASENRICITASAGLICHVGERAFLEKKAGVVLSRRSGKRSTTLKVPS
ncbi:hypothetical protein MKX08_009126 [Trichoderma sp. CBMAI-0020]|nr:hypothetical protein MKX08_009126 [Trichoderma sp. CBMAI-0020]